MRRARFAVLMSAAALAAGLASAASPAAGQSSGCAGENAEAGSTSPANLAASLTCLINAERKSAGLRILVISNKLLSAETSHVNDMLANRFLGHLGTDGSLPFDRAKRTGYLKRYRRYAIGENLAWGQTTAGTPLKVVSAWMSSPTHRRNILDGRFKQIGAVVATGSPVGATGSALDASASTYGVTFGFVQRKK